MKIKKLLLSFVLMMSMLFVVSCKDSDDNSNNPAETPSPITKVDPTVSVGVENRDYLVGESLNNIELVLSSGGTDGSVEWVNKELVLAQGQNTCDWIFTPTDTEQYKTKTGTVTINGLLKPQVVASVVEGQTVYIDAIYETISLQATATYEGEVVEGQIVWKAPNKVFKSGTNECEWQFIPTQRTKYAIVNSKNDNKIVLDATAEQTPTAIKVSCTKNQYLAFDRIEKKDLTICLVHNKGKVVEIEDKSDIEVSYLNGESLRRGDTSVTISYREFSTTLDGLNVDYQPLNVPTFDPVEYRGSEWILSIPQNPELYTFTPLKKTNADKYDLIVTLVDSENYKWANGDIGSTTVVCEILKADLIESEVDFNGEYDGLNHSASATNNIGSAVYYSDTTFDENNDGVVDRDKIEQADTVPINKINAGNHVIHYYMVGDENHNHKFGTLAVNISKQTPNISLEYCYTLKTGNVVNYPESYVSVVDKQGNSVELGELRMTYYSTYSDDGNAGNDVLTSTKDGVEAEDGTAPKNDRTSEYFVVVRYAGSENYNSIEKSTVLFIEGSDLEFYAKAGQDKFAFKYDENGFYGAERTINSVPVSITGSNSECNAYLGFEEYEDNGLKLVRFDAKFGEGDEGIKSGRLVFASGKYQLLSSDGTLYPFSYDSTDKEITINDGDVINEVTLIKWEIPRYLKTFTVQTVDDNDLSDENTSKFTEISFYNHYGTIRFSAKVNLIYTDGVVSSGGYEEWAGVAEVGFVNPDGQHLSYGLNCYIINKGTLDCSGYDKQTDAFSVSWYYISNGTNEPSAVTIYGQPQGSSLLSGFPYSELIGKTFAEKTA